VNEESKNVGPAMENVREKPVSVRVHVTNNWPPANPRVTLPSLSTNKIVCGRPLTVATIAKSGQTSGKAKSTENGSPGMMMGWAACAGGTSRRAVMTAAPSVPTIRRMDPSPSAGVDTETQRMRIDGADEWSERVVFRVIRLG
jgi:hypothetical protein